MKYFESFPKLIYTFDRNIINKQAVTNIFARSTFLKDIVNNIDISYEYQVKETDTPEVVAHKVYGDAYRSWIILLFNNIINPNYDWPMKNDVLDQYIFNKYGQNVDQARSAIHHYETEITKTAVYQGVVLSTNTETVTKGDYDINYRTNTITPAVLPTVGDTSITVSTETVNYPTYTLTIVTKINAVSNYTYEFELNEQRRNIRILDPAYIQRVEDEFRGLMLNG